MAWANRAEGTAGTHVLVSLWQFPLTLFEGTSDQQVPSKDAHSGEVGVRRTRRRICRDQRGALPLRVRALSDQYLFLNQQFHEAVNHRSALSAAGGRDSELLKALLSADHPLGLLRVGLLSAFSERGCGVSEPPTCEICGRSKPTPFTHCACLAAAFACCTRTNHS